MRPRFSRGPALAALLILIGLQSSPLLAADIQSNWSNELLWAGRIFNVVVLLGGLGFVLRKPLRKFFQTRTADIQKKLEEAEEARLEAVRKLSLMEERLLKLDEEVAAIRRQAQADAEAEQQRMLERAEEEAARVRARGRLEIEAEKAQALTELKQFVADKAVALAEEMIRREIEPADQERLFEKFLTELGEKR
jgi:F-type H+-transporting ATPase subunit b